MIFNPSFPYRFTHMMTAAYLTTSVVVLAAGARYLLQGKFQEEARTMLRMGIGMVAILGPAQLFFGDQHGLNTLEHQPAKIAAMEGHWENTGPAALVLFGIPDQDGERNRAEIAIPRLGGLILKHDLEWPLCRPEGLSQGRTVRPCCRSSLPSASWSALVFC